MTSCFISLSAGYYAGFFTGDAMNYYCWVLFYHTDARFEPGTVEFEA